MSIRFSTCHKLDIPGELPKTIDVCDGQTLAQSYDQKWNGPGKVVEEGENVVAGALGEHQRDDGADCTQHASDHFFSQSGKDFQVHKALRDKMQA